MTRPDHGYSRTVQYNSANHWEILFQIHGSIWKRVLPHCIVNVGLTILVRYLLEYRHIDLTVSEYGHEFMGLIVGFLVVSRCSKTFDVYFEFREYLDALFASTRETVQMACILTGDGYDNNKNNNNDSGDNASSEAVWRHEVAYYSIVLLRVTSAMLTRANSDGMNAWEVPELNSEERSFLLQNLENPLLYGSATSSASSQSMSSTIHAERQWTHGYHTDSDQNLRVPIRMAYKLRSVIMSHKNLVFESTLDSYREKQILDCVTNFMTGYYGLRKYLTTPFPFPLIQMEHTFLFFYVYTMSFALVKVFDTMLQNVLIVFIATYGFMGLDLVSCELDDPFGEEPSDLPVIGEMRSVIEDVYMTVLDRDGLSAVQKLQARVDRREGQVPPESFRKQYRHKQEFLESTRLLTVNARA
jgi:predicted membrane chloride channel (bestrophin family)